MMHDSSFTDSIERHWSLSKALPKRSNVQRANKNLGGPSPSPPETEAFGDDAGTQLYFTKFACKAVTDRCLYR